MYKRRIIMESAIKLKLAPSMIDTPGEGIFVYMI